MVCLFGQSGLCLYGQRPLRIPIWTAALQGGRTFISNGPALFLSVEGQGVGETVLCDVGSALTVTASWQSHYSVERVELLWNGTVVASRQVEGANAKAGELTVSFPAPSDGWLAARLSSHVRDSFFQPVFAHTSPTYVATGQRSPEQPQAAAFFDRAIDKALVWVNQRAKFRNDAQRREVVTLFEEGQAVYRGWGEGYAMTPKYEHFHCCYVDAALALANMSTMKRCRDRCGSMYASMHLVHHLRGASQITPDVG